jgi:hypothetical protein
MRKTENCAKMDLHEGHGEVSMLRGSCLCGGIKYQINGRLSGAMNCHCSMWASKAPWYRITDDLPQLPGAPQ